MWTHELVTMLSNVSPDWLSDVLAGALAGAFAAALTTPLDVLVTHMSTRQAGGANLNALQAITPPHKPPSTFTSISSLLPSHLALAPNSPSWLLLWLLFPLHCAPLAPRLLPFLPPSLLHLWPPHKTGSGGPRAGRRARASHPHSRDGAASALLRPLGWLLLWALRVLPLPPFARLRLGRNRRSQWPLQLQVVREHAILIIMARRL